MNTVYADQREAVIDLLVGAVPERRIELIGLWEQYSPKVEVVGELDDSGRPIQKSRASWFGDGTVTMSDGVDRDALPG